MIIVYLHIILINFCFLIGQSSTLSLYGNGEYLDNYDASSIALGESKYFGQNNSGFSLLSIASYAHSENSNLSMSLKFSSNDVSNVDKLKNNNFELLFFSFPYKKNRAIAFGMNPLYRSDVKIYEEDFVYIGADQLFPIDISSSQGPLSYKTDYSFSGGISELFIVYSSKLSHNFSYGIKWTKLFGTSKYEYVLDLYNVFYTDEGELYTTPFSTNNYIYNKHEYSSSKYNLEFKYLKNNFDLVLNYGQSKSLKIESTEYYHVLGIPYTDTFHNLGDMEQYDLGLKYTIDENLSIISEYHKVDSFDKLNFLNIFSYENPNINSFHLGMNYNVKNKKINKQWNNINYRFGIFNKSIEYDLFDVVDRGYTFGFGLEYLNSRNAINLAFSIGNRESDFVDFNNEEYVNFHLTILSGERWFDKERK